MLYLALYNNIIKIRLFFYFKTVSTIKLDSSSEEESLQIFIYYIGIIYN